MEKKAWKIIAILFIVLFILAAITSLFFYGGTLYHKAEASQYANWFEDCAENFEKCSDDFKNCSGYFHECLNTLENCCP